MSPFALRLRTLNATALGNESALRQETDRSGPRPIYAACRSAWIRSSRAVTWFQLANVRLTTDPHSFRQFFWLKDESLDDSDNLPDPDVIAAEIVEDLKAALEQFAEIQ